MSFTWFADRPLRSREQVMEVIVRVADDLAMPDRKGACIIAGMTVAQEAGDDDDDNDSVPEWWCPANPADPETLKYQHDSTSNDSKSSGYFQQQPPWWGTAAQRMDPYESCKLFMTSLKRYPYRATNAQEANDWAQKVQGSSFPNAYTKWWQLANDVYNNVKGTPTPPPAPDGQPYGMPNGSNSGGYGGGGVKFSDWVYRLGDAFGLKPSTYPGHQETDRIEDGYARNPQRLNRGIDWAAPGAPDEVARMQRFADYLFSIRGELEQVIWWNPDGRKIGVAGGKDVTNTPYYNYPGGYDDHRDHVHTRQSHSLPLPGGTQPPPVPPNPGTTARPQFEERQMFGKGGSKRSRQPINFFIHTEEGNGTAKSLAEYCQGQNNVSYHFTLRDRIVYDVVPTDLYSWSVLAANVFSVNLCFAGSRAGMSRAEWLQREGDIDVAAFIAVREARKFGFPTEVLAPQAGRTGRDVYAGEALPGISDHNYVTRELGIGDHTDVGPNFPWDVFTRYVNKYAQNPTQPGDDMALVPQDQWDRVFRELTQRHPSRSALRHLGEGDVDTWAGMTLNSDGNQHVQTVTMLARLGHPESLAVLKEVAGADLSKYPDRAADKELANNILADIYSTPAPVTEPVGPFAPAAPQYTNLSPSATEIASQVASLLPASDTSALLAENARLREENARLQASPAVVESTADKTPGQIAGGVVDSVTDYTKHLIAMDATQRQGHLAALKALQPSNGDQA